MHCTPNLDTFKAFADSGNCIPVLTRLMADFETPVSAYSKLREAGPAFLFESIEGGEHIGRYTFLGCRPRTILRVGEETTTLTHRDGREETVDTPEDPLVLLEQQMEGVEPVDRPGLPPFTGGAVGGIAYEYVSRIEPTVPIAGRDDLDTPLLYFLITDTVVIFDHAKQTVLVCANARLDDHPDPETAYTAAREEIEGLVNLLQTGRELAPAPLIQPETVEVPPGNFKRPAFESAVETVRAYIRAGDIIQGVLSQRFDRPFAGSPLDLYRALRIVNPSPYMFLLEAEDFAIIGASPEVHVRLTGDLVEIRPIAGTRPRGETTEEDVALEKDLLADEKERAEHLMLVDLARNDIGRVCRMGSVQVPDFMIVERYSHVMHIVSQVTGRLDRAHTAFDLMKATFPAGTVSGAPKVRAMQIIGELEGCRRGFYSGALGYFGYNGNHDSCIAIRTAVLKAGTLHIQAGAGIVADSVPAGEYQETVNKARALFTAVAQADELAGER
ncbi:MAG: anthranilate synthase component I [Opitutales bacterium]